MKRKHLILATVCLVMTSCSTNSQQATTSQEPVTTPVDVQEEVVSEVKPEVKELPSNSLTATGKVKAANYTDLYFRSQELIAHVYVKNGARVGKGQKIADLEVIALNSQLRQAEISLEQAKLELQDILIGQGYAPDHLDKVPADMMKLAKVKSASQDI